MSWDQVLPTLCVVFGIACAIFVAIAIYIDGICEEAFIRSTGRYPRDGRDKNFNKKEEKVEEI